MNILHNFLKVKNAAILIWGKILNPKHLGKLEYLNFVGLSTT